MHSPESAFKRKLLDIDLRTRLAPLLEVRSLPVNYMKKVLQKFPPSTLGIHVNPMQTLGSRTGTTTEAAKFFVRFKFNSDNALLFESSIRIVFDL